MHRLHRKKIVLVFGCCVFLFVVSVSRVFSWPLYVWLPGLELMTFETSIFLLMLSSALLSISLDFPRQYSLSLSALVFTCIVTYSLSNSYLPDHRLLTPPSPATLWMIGFLSIAMLLGHSRSPKFRHVGEYFGGFCLALALTSMLGLAAGTNYLFELGPFVTTSFYTSFVALILALAHLMLTPGGAVLALFHDSDVAGRFTRNLVVLVLLLLLVLALLANPQLGPEVFSSSSDLVVLFGVFLALMLMIIFTFGHLFRIETVESSTLEKKLGESTLQLEKILEIAPVGVLTVDQGGIIRSANRAAEEIFGFTHGCLVGTAVDNLLPPEFRSGHAVYRGLYSENPETRKMGVTRALKALKADDKEIDVEIFLNPIRINQSRMVVLSVSDISAHVQLTEELRHARDDLQKKVDDRTRELQQSNEQLLQKNSQLQQFAYAASHDLQTPLRGIGVYAGALKEDFNEALDERAFSYIDFVVKEAQRLQELINNLLNYASLDSSASGSFTSVDLNKVVDEIRDSLLPVFGANEFRITRNELPQLRGNPALITQLFNNLIENGLKYRGSESPCVEVGLADMEGDWAEIYVRDNGIGIDPAQHARIFEIFRRLHTQSEIPGTGIGLAICKRIVESHGGSIRLISEPGAGSTFYIRMPVYFFEHVEGASNA